MIATALAAACRLVSGAVVEWHCDPDATAQRIYFANHSSHLDFIVIWSALPPRLRRLTRPVAGRDYWDRGAVRRYLARQVFHAVLIERGHSASETASEAASETALGAARSAVQSIVHALGDRHSLIVFPEGTRSVTGEVGPFKSGLYHVSRLRPDAELIPVYLENLNRILPKGEAFPVPMLSRVVFGARLHPGAGDDKPQFLAQARSALIQLKARA
jgi:1-acyl-sn-glycerol-3-phosphate acyltransferase